jgi:hypothetical protein
MNMRHHPCDSSRLSAQRYSIYEGRAPVCDANERCMDVDDPLDWKIVEFFDEGSL